MSNHGGARKGAGRKPGSGTGRKTVAKQISLPPSAWEKLDKIRPPLSRSGWVKQQIENYEK